MKGLALKFLLQVLGLVALIGGTSAGIVNATGVAPVKTIGVSIGAGFFAWIAMALFVAAIRAARERRALRTGMAGVPPVDGRRAIIVGTIDALGAVLRAPLSDRECVAYTFELFKYQGSGKRRTRVTFAEGIALAPSAIVTQSGTYRLLAVPELDCQPSDLDSGTALPRAAELMRTVPCVPLVPFARPSVEARWSDDDGEYRRELRRFESPELPDEVQMTERVIERGARVCVFGAYSAERRAIVADRHDWSRIVRVMKGDPDAIVRQLGASVVRRSIGTIVFGAIAAALVAMFVSSLG